MAGGKLTIAIARISWIVTYQKHSKTNTTKELRTTMGIRILKGSNGGPLHTKCGMGFSGFGVIFYC